MLEIKVKRKKKGYDVKSEFMGERIEVMAELLAGVMSVLSDLSRLNNIAYGDMVDIFVGALKECKVREDAEDDFN